MNNLKKTLGILYFTTCFTLLFSRSAHAYIDPSVTTYTIQAIAGAAVAIGAFITIYWRRAKKKVNKALGIDENAKKVMEEEIIDFNPDEKNDANN